jgi:hypothetical protein
MFAAFSRNHTARISQLRNNGYKIEYRVTNEESGATEYRLVSEGGPKKTRTVECRVIVTGVDPDAAFGPTEVQYDFTCLGSREGNGRITLEIPADATVYAGDTMEVNWRFTD